MTLKLKINLSIFCTSIVLLMLVIIASVYSTEKAVLPNASPTETVEIIGPYTKLEIIKGFNTTRGNHVSFRSKEALLILKVKQISSTSETYLLYLTCIPYDEYIKLLNRGIRWPFISEEIIIGNLVKAIRENNVTLLKEMVKEIEKKFVEFRAYVKYSGSPIYLFELKPGEEVEIPIILEAPSGKVIKNYMFGAFLITPFTPAEGYSIGGAGGLYIGP